MSPSPAASIIARTSAIFGSIVGEVRLAAEAGVDGHHEHQLDEVEDVADGVGRRRRAEGDAGGRAELADLRRAPGAGGCTPRRGRSGAGTRPRRSAAAIRSGVYTIRWASNGRSVQERAEWMTSGPNVRLGTNWPSMTSHWMRSTPALSSAVTASPRRAKSTGSTDGAIWIGRASRASPRASERSGSAISVDGTRRSLADGARPSRCAPIGSRPAGRRSPARTAGGSCSCVARCPARRSPSS